MSLVDNYPVEIHPGAALIDALTTIISEHRFHSGNQFLVPLDVPRFVERRRLHHLQHAFIHLPAARFVALPAFALVQIAAGLLLRVSD